jgi:hypothetical protein
MQISNQLSEENFYYYFEGKEYCYTVEELADGQWTICSTLDLFMVANGSPVISNVSSVTEALQELSKVHPALAEAMLEPFVKRCQEAVNHYCGWNRDQKMYYHRN